MLRGVTVISALMASACAHAESTAPAVKNAGDAATNAPAKTNPGYHSDGLVRIASSYSVNETVARLEAALAARDIKVMATVDHAANAAGAGLDLAPTTLVLFGNPAAGTQLMQASRSAGIDLPMKALISEQNGVVMFEYNAIGYIADRHGVPADLPVLAKIEGLLAAVAAEATGVK